jgi:hypothetical protein
MVFVGQPTVIYSSGISLQTFNLALGTMGLDVHTVRGGDYTALILHLVSGCGLGGSVELQNSHGVLVTADPVSMEFDGDFHIGLGGTTLTRGILTLDIEPFKGALVDVTESAQIKTQIEATQGIVIRPN